MWSSQVETPLCRLPPIHEISSSIRRIAGLYSKGEILLAVNLIKEKIIPYLATDEDTEETFVQAILDSLVPPDHCVPYDIIYWYLNSTHDTICMVTAHMMERQDPAHEVCTLKK